MAKKLKLTIELVPKTSWLNNVRAVTTEQQWDYLRKTVASKAYNLCEICGGVGPKHPVECHEIWSFDSYKLIQKLDGMIALCPDCHMVKHIGFAGIKGKEKEAKTHFAKVNNLTLDEADKYIKQAFKTWDERSQYNWTLDLSILKEYGLNVEEIKKQEKTKAKK